MPGKSLGPRLLLYTSIQFVILSFGAMLFYPGGAMYQPGARHYLFLQNFFSDLGATLTRRSQSNLLSMILFIAALVPVGISLAIASPVWKRAIASPGRGMFFGTAAQVLSVLSGICYVGIAVTPWNLALGAHMLFVQGAFTLLLGFVVCLTVMQIQSRWLARYIASNLIYVVVLTAYVFVLFHGPNLLTLHGLVFQVIAQKIIVYVSILNLAYQTIGVIAAQEAAVPSSSSRIQCLETNS